MYQFDLGRAGGSAAVLWSRDLNSVTHHQRQQQLETDKSDKSDNINMESSNSEARLDLYTDNSFSDGEPVLAGNITVSGTAGQSDGQGGREFNTLDEPISHTIKRDLGAVGTKFAAVLWPKEKSSLLREWDLWGPLILCTLMATILQGHGDEDNKDGDTGDGGPQFAEVFVIVWVGAMIVTLNTKLLGE